MSVFVQLDVDKQTVSSLVSSRGTHRMWSPKRKKIKREKKKKEIKKDGSELGTRSRQ